MFTLGIIIFILALLAFVGSFFAMKTDIRKNQQVKPRRAVRIVVVFLVICGALSWVGASYNRVPTKNVGIVTSYSKPTGHTTGAGVHWTKPWENVEDWDATGQIFPDDGGSCTNVSIAAQRGACIPLKVEWKVIEGTAPEQWATYKVTDQGKKIDSDNPRFGTFIARRVDPGIRAALTSVFSSFDPLGNASATGDAPAPDLNAMFKDKMKDAIKTALTNADGSIDIEITNVVFTGSPTYDAPTTAAIAAYGQKLLQTRNLDVDAANATKRQSVSTKTGIPAEVQECLDIADAQNTDPGHCLWGGKVALTQPVG